MDIRFNVAEINSHADYVTTRVPLSAERQARQAIVLKKMDAAALSARQAAILTPFHEEVAIVVSKELPLRKAVREAQALAKTLSGPLPSLAGINPVAMLPTKHYLPSAAVMAHADPIVLAQQSVLERLNKAAAKLRADDSEGCAGQIEAIVATASEHLSSGVALDEVISEITSSLEDLSWSGDEETLKQGVASDLYDTLQAAKPFLFSKQVIADLLLASVDQLETSELFGYAQWLTEQRRSFLERVEGGVAINEAFDELVSALSDQDWAGEGATIHMELLAKLSRLPRNYVSKLPQAYRKDELMAELRFQMQQASDEDMPALQAVWEQVKNSEGDFVSSEVFVPKASRLSAYVAEADVIEALGSLEGARTALKRIAAAQDSSRAQFVYKMGAETYCELKAAKVLNLFGLDRFLTPKRSTHVHGLKIGEHLTGEGIASAFIEKTGEFPTDLWDRYVHARQQLAAAQYKLSHNLPEHPSEAEVAALVASVRDLSEQLKAIGGKDSALEQAMADMILRPSDGHPGQYIFNGEWHCIDFARLLAPARAYKATPVKGRQRDLETFVSFRSTFLAHPFAGEALPREKVDQLLAINMDEIETKLRAAGLVGDAARFAKLADMMHRARGFIVSLKDWAEDLESGITLSNPVLDTLLTAYDAAQQAGYAVQPGLTRDNPQALIATVLQAQLCKLNKNSKEAMSKIHPQALELLKHDIAALQTYLRAHLDNATLTEAFAHVNPDIAVFMKVIERLEGYDQPFESIGHANSDDERGFRSLESIRRDAIDQNMATEEEVAAMDAALERLKATSCTENEAATTMDIIPY